LTLPLSLLARPEFDYVALGHVHRHQVLCQQPPVIYPGSIERVDFGEEGEEKGFILAEISKTQTRWQFWPLPTRPFLTIDVDLAPISENPQAHLLAAIDPTAIDQAIVRLRYRLRPEQTALIDLPSLHERLAPAHSFRIQPELASQHPRSRLPELGLGQTIAPLRALELYLEGRPDLEEIKPDLLMAATSLFEEQIDHPAWGELTRSASSVSIASEPTHSSPMRTLDPQRKSDLVQLTLLSPDGLG
jgi:exonuclease SbcD